MIVRNWMQANPKTIPSHMLVSEAKQLLSENNLHALPVVDEGKLRGLVTRANLLRMGQFVMRTQNPDEFNFFVTRLKVRDIMVRNPATVEAGETMEQCLLKGQELGVAQFPVVDGERVVGVLVFGGSRDLSDDRGVVGALLEPFSTALVNDHRLHELGWG